MRRGDPRTVLLVNPGADLYGSDRMALETVRALVSAGRRVVVTVPESGPLVPLLEEAGAQVVESPSPVIRKGLLSVRGLIRLAMDALTAVLPSVKVIRQSGAGVVLVNTITPPLWLPLARMMGRLTVCHVHEGEASVSRWVQRALYLPLSFCHRIVINSAFSLKVLSESAPWLTSRTRVVYNAVAGPELVAPPRAALEPPIRLGYVGRLSHRKGPHVAVEALAEVRERGYDARLALTGAVFPGNEAYATSLHDTVRRLGLDGEVDFVGFRPSVWADLEACDIVLIPSTVDEPFGNTAVEAALAARPSVASAVGGLPEASRHSTSSIPVAPADADALAAAVVGIVEDWDAFAARAVQDSVTVAEHFSRKRYGMGMVAAVDSRRGSPPVTV